MIIITYSDITASSVVSSLGAPEYSYYFVLKEFRPLLEELGIVVTVTDPAREVDAIYRNARAHGQPCIFLSFSPPHKTEINLACPTIALFAWEFNTLPNEVWFNEPRHDWTMVLKQLGCAVTHSEFMVRTVRQAMGADYPIVSLPAPVWDRFAGRYDALADVQRNVTEIEVEGGVIDLREFDVTPYAPALRHEPKPNLVGQLKSAGAQAIRHIRLEGVVYVSVFNPYDGRKNWFDMICAFCWAFRDVEDATLVLKLTHADLQPMLDVMLENLYKLTPYRCRVIILYSFLSEAAYEKLVAATTYVVNTSHGEGQCLPLMEFMSSGKPAVAPLHTAMLDYLDTDNAFLIDSQTEPTHWPHDPRQAYRTLRYRVDWGSLLEAYRASYRVAKEEPARYAAMARHAVQKLEGHCSRAQIKRRLVEFLATQFDLPLHREVPKSVDAEPVTLVQAQ